jgi:predicted DNA-binding transcriptional regulator AlpA
LLDAHSGARSLNKEGIMLPAAEEHPVEDLAFLSKRDVLRLIPISGPTLWQWTRTGNFPAPRIIGSKTVWLASEVYAWMQTRPLRQYKQEG